MAAGGGTALSNRIGSGSRERYALKRRARIVRSALAPSLELASVENVISAEEMDALRQAQEAAAAEVSQFKETIMRQRADFDNFRRRVQKEKEQIRDSTREDLVAKLLPVVDNFERALASASNASDTTSIREGVTMISGQLMRALEGEGLTKIAALNEPFDPALHEAIATEERSDVPDHHVCEEMLPGYRFKDKVIRPAMVKVAKAPAAAEAPGA